MLYSNAEAHGQSRKAMNKLPSLSTLLLAKAFITRHCVGPNRISPLWRKLTTSSRTLWNAVKIANASKCKLAQQNNSCGVVVGWMRTTLFLDG